MEINIQIKNVQKPEDVLNAFAAISSVSGGRDRGIASGGREPGRSRPPIQRQAMRTTAATRRSPSLILSPQELTALQQVHLHGSAPSSTEADTVGEASSGVRPKMKPQPFSVFQRPARQHAGRTLSPRPYYQRGDQPGAGDQPATPRPTSTRQPLPIADNRAPETTSRPLLIRKSVLRSSRTSRSRTPKRTSPTRRTPKKDSRSPQKTSLSMDSRRTTRKIPVLKSRSRTPRADSRTPTPRTSRSRTPRASRLPTPRTSRSPTPRASRSPTPRATASASSSKVQPQQKIKKDLYTTPKMPSKISFSRNLRYYAVDWESFEVDAFPIQDSWKPYAYRPGFEFLVAYCWNTTQPGTEALSLH